MRKLGLWTVMIGAPLAFGGGGFGLFGLLGAYAGRPAIFIGLALILYDIADSVSKPDEWAELCKRANARNYKCE